MPARKAKAGGPGAASTARDLASTYKAGADVQKRSAPVGGAFRAVPPRRRPDSTEGAPGELVAARFPGTGTWGRVVLTARTERGWLAVRCTTRAKTSTGFLRVPVPDPMAVGLGQPAWLCALPVEVDERDLGLHIGWAEDGLVGAIASGCRLSPAEVAVLHRGVAHRRVRARLAELSAAGEDEGEGRP
jgi:hypothetical protein